MRRNLLSLKQQNFFHDKVSQHFDNTHSGAWIVYHELAGDKGKAPPPVIGLVNDIDLGKTDRDQFFPLAAFVDSFPIKGIGEILDSMNKINATSRDEMIATGSRIQQTLDNNIARALASKKWTKISFAEGIDPVYILIINADIQMLGRKGSLKLQELAENNASGTALTWFEDCTNGQDVVRLSVRTGKGLDAGKVAKYLAEDGHGMSGGGHAQIAAAQFTVEQFNQRFSRVSQADMLKEKGLENFLTIAQPVVTAVAEPSKIKARG